MKKLELIFDDYRLFKTSKFAASPSQQKPLGYTMQPPAYPEGLMGEVARFIYNSSPRPSLEVAITAAIGFFSGMAGRAYNVSRTGLNMYLLLLAQTGTGKEGMASSIDKLLFAMSQQVMTSLEIVGPAEIASGQALLKHLSNTSECFVSIIGEFGIKMQQLASTKASAADLMLKRVLLDLYNKSGHNKTLRPAIYADKDKNTKLIMSPAFSILAESTPETFYAALSQDLIADGLLPRFIIVEHTGKRPPLNKKHDEYKPEQSIIDRLCELATQCAMLTHNKKVLDVQQDRDAELFLDNIDKESTDRINASEDDVIRHLWNRAHIKTLKLAALVAVGVNAPAPVITLSIAQWAFNVVASDILNLSKRFERGEIGKNSDEVRQWADMVRIIAEYYAKPYELVEHYGVYRDMHQMKLIPYSYIQRRLVSLSSFRNDRQGATAAIKRMVNEFLETGELSRVSGIRLQGRGFYYTLSDPEAFAEKYCPQRDDLPKAVSAWQSPPKEKQ